LGLAGDLGKASMNNYDSDYDKFVHDRGIALEGIADLLLATADAIAAVRLARSGGIPILGGEVYVRRSGAIAPAYANWDTNPKPGESLHEYARRTWKESEEYLRAYPKPDDGEALFALVRWSSRLPKTD
jgi:hypothetical protein